MTAVAQAANGHYEQTYYDWQREVGTYSAKVDLFKFRDEIGVVDRLLDFGSGGGFILDALQAREKIGIEVNETAARDARAKGLTVLPSLDMVEDGSIDVIISHHALEHVDSPLEIVTAMLAKLKPGGKVVIVTPNESVSLRYREDDPNFHLFTWSPSNLGNLLKRAGFARITAEPVYHRWPPRWQALSRVLSVPMMHMLCVARGRLQTGYCQVKAVAYKPV